MKIRGFNEPTHPGEILSEEFLTPFGLTQTELATRLHTSFRAVNEIVNKKRGVTPEMALRLSRCFGTTPELWMNLQTKYDIYKAYKKKEDDLESIEEIVTV